MNEIDIPFPVPAAPPSPRRMGARQASRLLVQGTFGPDLAAIRATSAKDHATWIAEQAAIAPSLTLPAVQANPDVDWGAVWWRNAVRAPDQLRQRIAFALSEIFVTSAAPDGPTGPSANQAAFYDVLIRNALGNFRQLLEEVTLNPQMGLFLNMWRNDKADAAKGSHADQNYAREVMQLFTIGLVQLEPDGTTRRDTAGAPIPTYGQPDVEAMADVLTGWASHPVEHAGEDAWLYDQDHVDPMEPYAGHHDTKAKTIVGGVAVPAGGTARRDLAIALDTLFAHPNVGPFVGRQLIQRLVTSNPSRGYVARVAAAFADDGKGVRGNLLAVVLAILSDREARKTGGDGYGKLREPILRLTHLWRAFHAVDRLGGIDEYLVVTQARAIFAQQPLRAPSVFNFFVPDYSRAGRLADAGLVAPEFQITNENTAVRTVNQIMRQAYRFVDSTGTVHFAPDGYSEVDSLDETSVLLHTRAWEPYARNPEKLLAVLDVVFMQGLMPDAMRTAILRYVRGIPATEVAGLAYRVVEAAELVVNSPQYAVQR